ncbi:MAG: GxxExxY protein [Alloprevotella sp.]|nr:GxxExxY protein [Alloprevotella sp.]
MAVHGALGRGFLEAVYQEALSLEFASLGIPFCQQKELDIYYRGTKLNKKYYADFVCYDRIIVELKATDSIAPEHEAQLINYLRATNMKLGLLINFGEDSLHFRRFIN